MPRDRTKPPDWREPADYAGLRGMDHCAFAWELLRRNARYRSRAAALDRPTGEDGGLLTISPAAARIAAEWGLSFPRRSGTERSRRPDLLAA